MAPGFSTLLAVPFSELTNIVPLPDKRPFPAVVQSIGDHLKHARLTRNMLIKDVCAEIKVDRDTLRGWELGKFEPHVCHYPLIVSFLGYSPCIIETDSWAGKIKEYRYRHGLTQMQFGNLLRTDASIVWQWECNGRIPIVITQKKILALIQKG